MKKDTLYNKQQNHEFEMHTQVHMKFYFMFFFLESVCTGYDFRNNTNVFKAAQGNYSAVGDFNHIHKFMVKAKSKIIWKLFFTMCIYPIDVTID